MGCRVISTFRGNLFLEIFVMNGDNTKDVPPSRTPEDDDSALTPDELVAEEELTDDECATISGGVVVHGAPLSPRRHRARGHPIEFCRSGKRAGKYRDPGNNQMFPGFFCLHFPEHRR